MKKSVWFIRHPGKSCSTVPASRCLSPAKCRRCDELCPPQVGKGPAGKKLGAVRIPVCQNRLMAAVCSSLGLPVGGIKAGESQLLFPSLGFEAECGLAWLSGMMLSPAQSTTSLSTSWWFVSKCSFLLCCAQAKAHQSHCAGSSPKFLSLLSYLFVLAFLENYCMADLPVVAAFVTVFVIRGQTLR